MNNTKVAASKVAASKLDYKILAAYKIRLADLKFVSSDLKVKMVETSYQVMRLLWKQKQQKRSMNPNRMFGKSKMET